MQGHLAPTGMSKITSQIFRINQQILLVNIHADQIELDILNYKRIEELDSDILN